MAMREKKFGSSKEKARSSNLLWASNSRRLRCGKLEGVRLCVVKGEGQMLLRKELWAS
jgi:hypothetical protein